MSKRTFYRKVQKATQLDLEDVAVRQSAHTENELVAREPPTEDLQVNSVLDVAFDNDNDYEYLSETSSIELIKPSNSDHCDGIIAPPIKDISKNYESSYSEQNVFECSPSNTNDFTEDMFDCSHSKANGCEENMFESSPSKANDFEEDISESPPITFSSRLADWALDNNITHKSVSSLLKILHDGHPDLPLDARKLLGTIRDKAPVLPMGKGKFIYFGLSKGLSELLSTLVNHPADLILTINIDGQSPYRSSKMELWPILVMIDGILHKPIIVCAYYGRGKPPCYDFLEMFVNELLDLMNNGLNHKGQTLRVISRAFICDFPAVAHIKCTLNSNGFLGCSKCFVQGFSVDHTTVFHDLNAKLRTDENFRSMEQQGHHHGKSILLRLAIDLIKKFPLDSMHVIFLNVIKRLCAVWRLGKNRFYQLRVTRRKKVAYVLRKKKKRGNKMTAASVKAVDDRILNINKYMPSEEFGRIMDPFSESDSWKASQGRQFILYLAPVALKGILSDELFTHMTWLHMACRIMSSPILCPSMLNEAEEMLRKFVSKCKHLLGCDFTSQAVHALIHLAADCLEHGTLDQFSAFPFESYQGELRNLLRSYTKPLEQLWKRLSERANRSHPPIVVSVPDLISKAVRAKREDGPTSGQTGEHYSSLKFKGVAMSTKPKSNTFCLLDGTIIKASNFIRNGPSWFVIGQMFTNCRDFYPGSSKVFEWKVSGLTNQHFCWPLDYVVGKAVLIPYKHHFVCSQLLHTSIVSTVLYDCSN